MNKIVLQLAVFKRSFYRQQFLGRRSEYNLAYGACLEGKGYTVK